MNDETDPYSVNYKKLGQRPSKGAEIHYTIRKGKQRGTGKDNTIIRGYSYEDFTPETRLLFQMERRQFGLGLF